MSKSATLMRLAASKKSAAGAENNFERWIVQDLTKTLLARMEACISSGSVHEHWQIF
jgi:hypothetical protein